MIPEPKYKQGQKVWRSSWYYDPSFYEGEISNARIINPLSLYPRVEYELDRYRYNWYPEDSLFESLEQAIEHAKHNRPH